MRGMVSERVRGRARERERAIRPDTAPFEFKADRLLYHSTLGLEVIKKKKRALFSGVSRATTGGRDVSRAVTARGIRLTASPKTVWLNVPRHLAEKNVLSGLRGKLR